MSVDFRTLLVELPGKVGKGSEFRMFEPVTVLPRAFVVSAIEISVQASRFHYSTPRSILPVYQYEAWEVAVMRDGVIINPRDLPWFPHMATMCWEDDERPVGGYVPTATVQAVFDAAELAWARLEAGSCTHADCLEHQDLAIACVLQRWEELKNNRPPGEPKDESAAEVGEVT